MSASAIVERAQRQLAGSRRQRLMQWRTTLTTAAQEPGFLDEHSDSFCELVVGTLRPAYDKPCSAAVLACLSHALRNQTFFKAFANLYVKQLTPSAPVRSRSELLTLVSWGAALLTALQSHPKFPDAARTKLLTAVSSVSAQVLQPGQTRRARLAALHTLMQPLRLHSQLHEAALKQLKSEAPCPALAAALLCCSPDSAAVRAAALAAYTAGVIACKEKVADRQARAWLAAVETFTPSELAAVLDAVAGAVKRSADAALANAAAVFACRMPTTALAEQAASTLVALLKHSKESVVERAAAALQQVGERLRDADAMAAAAGAVVGSLTGRLGAKPKAVKDRSLLARAVGSMCPCYSDQRLLHALSGDVRAAALSVVQELTGYLQGESTADVRAHVVTAVEAWLLLAGFHGLFVGGAGTAQCTRQDAAAAGAVANLTAPLTGTQAESRRGALRCLAALALIPGCGAALAAVASPVAKLVADGVSKGAMRLDGQLAFGLLVTAGPAAAAGGTPPLDWLSCIAKLYTPEALRTLGWHQFHVAVTLRRVLCTQPPSEALHTACAAALAHLCSAGDGVTRSVSNAVLPACGEGRPTVTATLVSELWRVLSTGAYLEPGAREVPGDEEGFVGPTPLRQRIYRTAAACFPCVQQQLHVLGELLLLLFHPRLLHGCSTRSIDTAVHVCVAHSEPSIDGAAAVVCADYLAEQLVLSEPTVGGDEGAEEGSDGASRRLAAQLGLAVLLRLAPAAVWPTCMDILRRTLNPSKLDGLSARDLRVYNTPRGTLMIEQFREQLTPDQLFEESQAVQASERSLPTAGGQGSRGGRGAAGKKVSKEEQQRAARLEVEEAVRQHVEGIRRQLQLGCGLVVQVANAVPATTAAANNELVALLLPLLRLPLTAEPPQRIAVPGEHGALQAATALAACLPTSGLESTAAAALRATAVHQHAMRSRDGDSGKDPMLLAVQPAVKMLVDTLAEAVGSGRPVSGPAYALVFPVLRAVLGLPSQSGLQANAMALIAAEVRPLGADNGQQAGSGPDVAVIGELLEQHLEVLFHVITVAPSYRRSAQDMLSVLLAQAKSPRDVHAALGGLLLPDSDSRAAAITAATAAGFYTRLDITPIVESVEAACTLWIAVHDVNKDNAVAACELWELLDDCPSDEELVQGSLKQLASSSADVRAAAARAACAAARGDSDLVHAICAFILDVSADDAAVAAGVRTSELRRSGCARAIAEVAALLTTQTQVCMLMRFVLERGLTVRDERIQTEYVEAGTALVDAHGGTHLAEIMPLIERYLENDGTFAEELYDQVRTGAVVFLSGMARHLPNDDPKIQKVVLVLKELLSTPSEVVQVTVSNALVPIAPKLANQDQIGELVQYFLTTLTSDTSYGRRRGAAFGLAGVVKGMGIAVLKKQAIVDAIKAAMDSKSPPDAKEGGLLAVECLCMKLGRMFEPYVTAVLPMLLASFGDSHPKVRAAAQDASNAIMANLSAPGVRLILPTLLKGLQERAWRSKEASAKMLGSMANCAPQQLATSLPTVVPGLASALADAHPKVQAAADTAIKSLGGTVQNPEVKVLAPLLIKAIADPIKATRLALESLRDTVFVHVIDMSALALILPIIGRGLKERASDQKRYAARILGNLSSLVANPKDLAPYMPTLLPDLQSVLVDPLPDVRATAARALGSLIRGLGQQYITDVLPWLMTTLSSEASSAERSGAALGLSEVVGVLGGDYLAALMPSVVAGCADRAAAVRDGNLTLLAHLPVSCPQAFEKHLPETLPCVLRGLADETDEVRTTALAVAMKVVELYALTSTPLLMPVLEVGLTNENWRIRESSVKLMGELLYKIAGTTGRVKLDGGSDDEGAATESYAAALLETLGVETRNSVLARLYLVRCDGAAQVRQASVHVWKSVVVNTPRTLKQILPRLLDLAVETISGNGEEAQSMASRCLGELVRKMGHEVGRMIIPSLLTAMADESRNRVGVCASLAEVAEAMDRSQLTEHLPSIVPAIQSALCDPSQHVRDAAGAAFAVLFRGGTASLVQTVIPSLLEGLVVPGREGESIKGLQVVLSVRPPLLERVLPKLLALPLQATHVAAVAPVMRELVGDPHVVTQLSFALPRLLALPPEQAADAELRRGCHEAAVGMAAATAGNAAAVAELVKVSLKHLAEPRGRRAAAELLRDWIRTAQDVDIHKPMLLASTVELFSGEVEDDAGALLAVWEAAKAVLDSIDKADLAGHINTLRRALGSAFDAAQREAGQGEDVHVAGFNLPKGMGPIVETYVHGLHNGTSADMREASAAALGEAVAAAPPSALKPYILKITGPLIRYIGDRFPPAVKVAILKALGLIIGKAGPDLRAFVPQLQTTFVKCLPDGSAQIRLQAAQNLGTLAKLMTARVDQLAKDLVEKAAACEAGMKEAYLLALRGVLAHAAPKMTSASLPVIGETLLRMASTIDGENEELQIALASCLGEYCGVAPEGEARDMLTDYPLRSPLPRERQVAAVGATLLAVLVKNHASRLADLGLLADALEAAKRMVVHTEFSVKVAAVRVFGRVVAWALGCDRLREVAAVSEVIQTALAPDQDRSLHAEAIHQLKQLAKLAEGREGVLDDLLVRVLPSICGAIAVAHGTALVTSERCLAHLLQVHEGMEQARRLVQAPGVGGTVKNMLSDSYLKKLSTMPLSSTFDTVIEELY